MFGIILKSKNASTVGISSVLQFRHNLNFAELRKEKEPKRKVWFLAFIQNSSSLEQTLRKFDGSHSQLCELRTRPHSQGSCAHAPSGASLALLANTTVDIRAGFNRCYRIWSNFFRNSLDLCSNSWHAWRAPSEHSFTWWTGELYCHARCRPSLAQPPFVMNAICPRSDRR